MGREGIWAAVSAALAFLAPVPTARAEEPTLPVQLQAGFLAKVAEYDRNLPGLAAGKIVVVIVTRDGDVDSTSAGSHMRAGLGAMSAIAGLPHEEIIVSWAGALRLAELSKNVGASIVYLGPGLGHDVPAIATALGGSSILTAGAMADYVTKGAVLGFDVVSGRARILVHLGQARQQHVDLAAQVLKLAVIVE